MPDHVALLGSNGHGVGLQFGIEKNGGNRRPDSVGVVALVGTVDRGTIERRGASFPDFIDWRAEATAGFCGWRRRPDARTTCFTSRLQSIKCESPGIAIVSDIRTPVPARNVRI
jgi:hypothetical protein